MRVQVEAHADGVGTTPRSLYWDQRRLGIVDMIDQWYGPDYRYVKIKGDDGGVYILVRGRSVGVATMIMFASARGQALAMQAAHGNMLALRAT